MMKVRRPLLTALALLTGCPSTPEPSPPPSPDPTVSPDPTPVTTTQPAKPDATAPIPDATKMGLALYARAKKPGENLALSPVSLQMALAMTYGGAAGETAAEMEEALGFNASIHGAMSTAMARYAGSDEAPFELAVANRIFTDDALTLKPTFLSLTRERYGAAAEGLDFRGEAEAARSTINDWVKSQTRDKIPELLPKGSISDDTRLVLTNAVYFKGQWSVPFEEEKTKPGSFAAANGEKKVPMMHKEARFKYAEADGAQLLEMGYRGGAWSMVLALPTAKDGLEALEGGLTEKSLDGWREAMDATAVQVSLPKFELKPSSPLALGSALRDMGVKLAFDPVSADFSGMAVPSAQGRISISEVFHRAYVKVNEKGTEAAAATGTVMKTTSLPMPAPNPKIFTADHPFLFFLVDTETGSPMFMGRVVNPS